MQDAIVLTEEFKAAFAWWCLGLLVGAPLVVNQFLSAWSKIRRKPEESVTRSEFDAIKRQLDSLVTRTEFSYMEANIRDIKESQNKSDTTLKKISEELFLTLGEIRARKI